MYDMTEEDYYIKNQLRKIRQKWVAVEGEGTIYFFSKNCCNLTNMSTYNECS